MLSYGVFPPAPVLSCAHTHSQLSKMCFLDQEIIFYHTLLSPKSRLWTTLITLLNTTKKTPKSLSPFQSSCLVFHNLFLAKPLHSLPELCRIQLLPHTLLTSHSLKSSSYWGCFSPSAFLSQHSLGLCWDEVISSPTFVDELHPEQPHSTAHVPFHVLPHGCRQWQC